MDLNELKKEAEEYAKNREVCDLLDAISENLQNYDYGTVAHYNIDPLVEECFKDGAEFGYNKAKVEVEDSYRESLCNSELNLASVTEQLEELEKANEWHYVKDKDYPKDNKPVLCILGDIDSDNCEVGYYNDVGSGEPWHFETYHLPDDDGDNAWGVSAWKEIVLPELKESE